MNDGEPAIAGAERSPELERLRRGLQLGEFFAMSDAEMERAAQLLMADDQGYMSFSAAHYLEELDRRATMRHTRQVEAYAARLDGFTRWLLAFTLVIVLQTTALIGLEIDALHPGAGWPVAAAVLCFASALVILANWVDTVVVRRWFRKSPRRPEPIP